MGESLSVRRRRADEALEAEREQIDELLRASQAVIFAGAPDDDSAWSPDLRRLADATSALTGSDYGQRDIPE